MLAVSHDLELVVAGWLILGVGMAMGLYDAAFAALAGIYGRAARGPITGITLIAGFASTIGWPITAALDAAYGWRVACLVWAGVHLLVCLPLNLFLLPRPIRQETPAAGPAAEAAPADDRSMRKTMWLLALMFSLAWFVTGAMATHLPRLLQEAGASTTAAIAAAALVGPAQVAARLAEFGLFRNFHPLYSARLSVTLHPIGAAILVGMGAPAVPFFAFLHGAGNGLLTIARGTLPLALFGSTAYGLRSGLIGAPARLTQAAAPFLFGLVLELVADDGARALLEPDARLAAVPDVLERRTSGSARAAGVRPFAACRPRDNVLPTSDCPSPRGAHNRGHSKGMSSAWEEQQCRTRSTMCRPSGRAGPSSTTRST